MEIASSQFVDQRRGVAGVSEAETGHGVLVGLDRAWETYSFDTKLMIIYDISSKVNEF